jgi:hypothetical protein
MKRKYLTMLLSMSLAVDFLSSCGQPAADSISSSSKPAAPTLTSKTLPLYLMSATSQSELTLAYADGDDSIPFISLEDGLSILKKVYAALDDDKYNLTLADQDGLITLKRENGAYAQLDFAKKTCCFSDFDSFITLSFTADPCDILSRPCFDSEGKPVYVKRTLSSDFYQKGYPVKLDLGAYDIPMYYVGGHGYLPLATFSDLFTSPENYTELYNKQCVIVTDGGPSGDFSPLFYAAPTGQRTASLAQFSYNELKLAYDAFYGLKEIHGITDAESFIANAGLKDDLLSLDPVVSSKALAKFYFGFMGDSHSGYRSNSYLVGKDTSIVKSDILNPSVSDSLKTGLLFSAYRSAFSINQGYQEIGDTAYVTFDHFYFAKSDYYKTPATASETDTVGILSYANSKIKRTDSPIKNVVLDLSCNQGGDADAAIYVLSWMLGDGFIHLKDTSSKAQATTYYRCDANMDHEFNSDDTVYGMNLYCLVSPISFSCGNLVPAMFKESGKVGLIGQTTGGGTGSPLPMSLPDGTSYAESGFRQVSTLKNGSYYDIDRGVEADYFLSKISDFYDRSALTSYIDSLK